MSVAFDELGRQSVAKGNLQEHLACLIGDVKCGAERGNSRQNSVCQKLPRSQDGLMLCCLQIDGLSTVRVFDETVCDLLM